MLHGCLQPYWPLSNTVLVLCDALVLYVACAAYSISGWSSARLECLGRTMQIGKLCIAFRNVEQITKMTPVVLSPLTLTPINFNCMAMVWHK